MNFLGPRGHQRASHNRASRPQMNFLGPLVAFVPTAKLADLREAVNTLKDTDRIARRVLGSTHPITGCTDFNLRKSKAILRAREAPSQR